MQLLPTNTALRVTVGPFLDFDDGVTPEIALTVTNTTCSMKVNKDDGSAVLRTAITLTASGGNNDMTHITDDTEGYYDLELTQAQLNFLGRMELSFSDPDVHCPVWKEYMVVPAPIYNAMVLGTDNINAQVKGIDNDIITAASLKADAVNEITAAIWAKIVDGTITFEKMSKIILAFTAGKVVITSNSFAFYDQSNVLLFTLPITASGRITVIT